MYQISIVRGVKNICIDILSTVNTNPDDPFEIATTYAVTGVSH